MRSEAELGQELLRQGLLQPWEGEWCREHKKNLWRPEPTSGHQGRGPIYIIRDN